jgi:uncharacterized membrane protein YphA (DoxX/SURF4 family)
LQRLFFSTFPGGKPGIGLLLLRAGVGAAAITQGGIYLADRRNLTLWTWAVGLLAIAGGASLLIGFLTKAACVLAALASIIVALPWLPAPPFSLFSSKLSLVFVGIMTAAIILLGPGAFSLDCRLFGRREIIIPHGNRSPKY